MNDIEILEDIISEYKATAIEWKFGNVPVHLDERDIEAIENLIQRNKDLEEIEKEHKEENGRLREKLDKKNETEKLRYYKRGFYAGFECFENRLRENLESLKKDYKEALEENSTKAFILKNVK